MKAPSLSILLLALAGCASSTPQGPELAAEGEACASGADCQDDLFCLVPVADQDGTCEPIPAACLADPSCTSGCFDSFDGGCANGSSCVAIGGNVTHACL